MISKDKMSVTVGVAFVWFTTQFGGGFASGNQLRQYFVQFGIWAFVTCIMTQFLGAFFQWYALKYAKKHEVYDYRSFNNSFYGKYAPIFSNLYELVYIVTICVAPAAAFATGVSTMESAFGVNHWVGTIQYKNILETLEGAMVVGDENDYFNQGKVLIAAANPDMMEYYISEHDLVILGNRYESQLCAIEMEADCIIVCEGAAVSMTIRKLAQEHGCTVMTTPYDAYTAARLINQSMPIGHFMKTEDLITFEDSDCIDDVKEVMASKRHRDFPVLDKDGKYLGMISRRNLLGAKGKQIILVDHNEKNQAVDGLENADIQEIIDHHKLGTVETISPVFFRNQPVGCTATIVYQMYHENNVEIDKATAGMLCSAIISDTLLFRSPTCTPIDKMAATELAKIAEIDMDRYAADMFSAGSNLRGKSNDEIFYQDFKLFNSGKTSYGVGQISSLNADELVELKERLLPFLKKPHEEHGVDMIFFMLTNILTESTSLLCEGEGAEDLIRTAFHMEAAGENDEANVVELPGVVSRKKQLIPSIMIACEN